LQKNDVSFKKELDSLTSQEEERQETAEEAIYKNEQLIEILEVKRSQFAGIGTNKTKQSVD
jgi:hypothetical protein